MPYTLPLYRLSADDVIDVRSAACMAAGRIVPPAIAEDIAHDVLLQMVSAEELLRDPHDTGALSVYPIDQKPPALNVLAVVRHRAALRARSWLRARIREMALFVAYTKIYREPAENVYMVAEAADGSVMDYFHQIFLDASRGHENRSFPGVAGTHVLSRIGGLAKSSAARTRAHRLLVRTCSSYLQDFAEELKNRAEKKKRPLTNRRNIDDRASKMLEWFLTKRRVATARLLMHGVFTLTSVVNKAA